MTAPPDTPLSIYISSFDDYADAWDPFFKRFFKYWTDCPYPVHLGAVEKTYPDSRVLTLHAANHNNWSSRAVEHLQQIETPFVLMMLEDYMVDRPVNTPTIQAIVEKMDRYDLHAVRLYPEPPPVTGLQGEPLLGLQGLGQVNRTSTHATIWRRETLLQIIRPGESLWQFESHGATRSNQYAGGICGTWEPVIHYVMAIGKGRWFRAGLRSLARDGIHPDLSVRRAETAKEETHAWIEAKIGALVRTILPLHIRQRLLLKIRPHTYDH